MFNFMAASGSSGSIGGYNVAFLTAEQQECFAAVRIKLYASYPDLAKAFYTCLKTDEDGSLSSPVKVPRSATFSTYPKGDSDMMFWAIQNQDINMAQVIIERMRFAAEIIWDKKNKLVVSLPYVHFLTRIFKEYGIDLKGEVMEKMGQPIRSRNLKKSSFSLEEEVEAVVRVEEPPTRRIEDIEPAHIVPIEPSTEMEIPSTVPAPVFEESISLETIAHVEGEQEETIMEDIPTFPAVDVNVEVGQEEAIPEVVAIGHTEDVQMEEAPAQGEHDLQEEPTASVATDKFKEASDDVDIELVVSSGKKGKGVATKIPLLTRKAHRRSKKKKIRVHLKPVIERINAHREILCSVQSDIFSIFISQSTGVKEIGAVKVELQGMKGELGSLKKLVTELSNFMRVHMSSPAPPAPTHSVQAEPTVVKESGPSGPFVEEESGPPGPAVKESGPPGPSMVESGPTGPLAGESGLSGPLESEAEQVRIQEPVEEVVVPPEPPVPSSFQTPAPSSPPPSFSAPPAPEPSKKPVPKHISSPTPFPSTSTSSPIYSTAIPPPPIFEDPPASSSAGPSSAEHLTLVLPLSPVSKADQSKIFSLAESKIEDQWARGHQSLYRKFGLARLREVQLGQFRAAIDQLRTENPVNTALQVDFATLEMPNICAGHQQWVGVQVCDVYCVLAAMVLPLTWVTRAFFFPHFLLSSSPTFTLVPIHYFRRSTGARGKAVIRAAAADQAGNGGLEGGIRGKLLGFWRDSKFFRSLIAYLSVVVRRLFRNASLVGYPGFFVSQARVFVVLGVCPVGPFVRDCETERLFLCCVVRVGYWPDQPVVHSRVVASFLSDSCFATRCGL
ncbi:hypothetical protein Taro_033576 [Colocasia esculenta]|uniref:Uncharacterized protein n=1 Tax=Colocasia esculenta TaxID=4460 RepID=A0A843VU61_COLES|nr:hypothetical protein [Colocasia esculenta]